MARDLRLFYAFRLLATSYLWQPCFLAFMVSRGLSFSQAVALGGVYSAILIIAEVPTGAFADRIGRRASMMVGAAAMVASSAVSYYAHSIAAFGAAECLAAISMSLCSGADSAYLYDLLSDRGVAHEYDRREATASAAHLIGAAAACAAGGMLAEIDLALPYLATGAVAAGALLIAAFMHDDGPRVPRVAQVPLGTELGAWFHHMREAVRDVLRSGRLAWLVGYSAVVFVLLRATTYLYQPYLDAQSFSLREVGFVFAGVNVVGAFVAHQSHAVRRRVGDERLLWGLLASLAISFVALAAARGPWAIAVIGVQAAATGLYSPLVKPLLNREIRDSGRRATVLSVESIARRAAMALFLPLAGLAGAAGALTLCGVVGLGGLIVLAIASRGPTPRQDRGVPTRVGAEAVD
ncbi:MAG: MFS transporter [Deltaproteobacteria bacterium]|nr:MFS transporter [Deltaproteobacteria bacterium]